MIHVITIPHWLPTSDNKLVTAHWATANRLKKADASMIWLHMREERIPAAQKKRRVQVLLMCKPKGRMPDPTNFAKSLLDAMVKCQLIKDDSQKWCEYITLKIERGTKQIWGTKISLEDIE